MTRTGDTNERRAKAREARYEGKSPADARVTTGASKQPRNLGGKQAKKRNAAMHQQKGKGKS